MKTKLEAKFEGWRVRSKARWVEQGEKSSAYFHRLIAARRQATRISTLRSATQGGLVTETDKLVKEAREFYAKLYEQGQTSEADQDFLLEQVEKQLSGGQREKMEEDISEEEVREAIQTAPNGSSPGSDGLPYEFYKTVREALVPFLTQLYNSMMEGGTTPPSMKQALISLIYKQKGEEEDLKNWRPISLLNCDRKLFARILVTRLQNQVGSVIHESQTGFVKRRLIQDNTMMVQQILDHHRTTGEDGAMVFLDQEKAYDKVDRRYLEKCLIKFGVGPRWRTGAECLLTGLSARVLVNGFQSNTLEVQQGVPQGDPLSPVLYDLAVEPLLCYLRNKLKGLPLGGHPFQCSAFADDIAVGLADEEDQRVLLKGLQLHEKACNAKLNLDKTNSCRCH